MTDSVTNSRRGLQIRWLAACLCACLLACGPGGEAEPDAESSEADATARAEAFEWPQGPRPSVRLRIVDMGEIEIALYPELAPKSVANFLELAEKGFYDDTTFHRVIPDFMIQGGDPNTRDDKDPDNDGKGGPGYYLDDEFSDAPHVRGVVSMSNDGRPNSGGSQFFILQKDADHLNGNHTVIGRVVNGIEIVDRIAEVERDLDGRWGPVDRPISNVVVGGIVVMKATPEGVGTLDMARAVDAPR
jgi:peptidyl-prolyl cis-trans isomerase B (cyclophilin B)